MLTANVRGIEKILKEETGALVVISVNKKHTYILKCYHKKDPVEVYTGYSLKNVLTKASKFLPVKMAETQVCIMANDETRNSLEFALNDANLAMFIYAQDENYNIELFSKTDKEKEKAVFSENGTFKEGLIGVFNKLETTLNEKVLDFKMAHPKEFGIED